MNPTKQDHRFGFAVLPTGTAQKKLKQRVNHSLLQKKQR